ncbi:hypothetical protein I315_03545 [Cryptococcus gattii Ru294]|nr:hypothetical protein I315_03545 [Cryptococcus gattii Ru294]
MTMSPPPQPLFPSKKPSRTTLCFRFHLHRCRRPRGPRERQCQRLLRSATTTYKLCECSSKHPCAKTK